jgi:hypothetical protein
MPVNSSSDPNTETEYHNPSPTGLQDMRNLLIRLETVQMENTPLIIKYKESSTDNVHESIPKHVLELWDYCLWTAAYGFGISDRIRIEILNLARLILPLHDSGNPELVITQLIAIEPVLKKIIETNGINSKLLDAQTTHDNLVKLSDFMERYIKKNVKLNKDWFAWKDNNYIVYTENSVKYFCDSISNWDNIIIDTTPYFKHKRSLKCYKNIQRRQLKQGDTLINVYKGKKSILVTQICTSDLAGPVDQVRPCRCAGCRCRGCECCNSCGQDGRCRCHCVHDTYK